MATTRVTELREKLMSSPKRPKLTTARNTLKVRCEFVSLVGKLNHIEAARIVERWTRKEVKLPESCICKDRGIRKAS